MQYKKMGRTGLKISEITLGTMIFGQQVDETEANKIIDLAFEKGINSFDTADGYAGGRSEEIVGKALKNKRHSVVLATKVSSRQAPAPTTSASRENISFRPLKTACGDWGRITSISITPTRRTTPPPSRKRCGRSIPWSGRAKCDISPAPIIAPGSWCGPWPSASSG